MPGPEVVREAASVWRPERPVDLRRTLAPLSRGRADPTHVVAADGAVWRTTRTEDGPATYRLQQRGPHEIACHAWGPGADRALAGLHQAGVRATMGVAPATPAICNA